MLGETSGVHEAEEGQNLVRVRPQELMRNSLGFVSLTPQVLRGGEFDPKIYRTAIGEVVYVLDAQENRVLMPADGHNRFGGAARKGIHELWARDSTRQIIQDLGLDPEQTALTTGQYIEWMRTLNNSKDDDQRITAQIFTEWDMLAGRSVGHRSSAFANLLFLSFSNIRDRGPKEIERILDSPSHSRYPGEVMVDAAVEEKQTLVNGLVGMASSIDKINISYQDLIIHGFWVVNEMLNSPDSEMRDAGHRQIRGLLSFPSVHEKIRATAIDESVIEQRQLELERLFIAGVSALDLDKKGVVTLQEIRAFNNFLVDPDFTYAQVVTAFTNYIENKEGMTLNDFYKKEKKVANIQILVTKYGDNVEIVSPIATNLIENVAGDTPLSDAEKIALVTAVMNADDAIKKLDVFIKNVNAANTELHSTRLMEVKAFFDKLKQQLFKETHPRALLRYAANINNSLAQYGPIIAQERKARRGDPPPGGSEEVRKPQAAGETVEEEPAESDVVIYEASSLGEVVTGLTQRVEGMEEVHDDERTVLFAFWEVLKDKLGIVDISFPAKDAPSTVLSSAKELSRIADTTDPSTLTPQTVEALAAARTAINRLLGSDPVEKKETGNEEIRFPDDWDIIPFDADRDGRESKWFLDRLKQGKELVTGDRWRITRMIDQATRKVFPRLKSEWNDITKSLKDKAGHEGLNAIDASLTSRLAKIASTCGWDKLTPEFAFLSANHYVLSVRASLDALASTDADLAERLMTRGVAMEEAIKAYTRRTLPLKTDRYLELLQYILYTSSELPQNKNALNYISMKNNDGVALQNRLHALKEGSGYERVEDAFSSIF